jgi:hypothetical protein
MEILILTNSYDGSANIIQNILKKKNLKFLRWNVDLWDKYEIYFDQDHFSLKDPLKNSVSSNNDLKILWRKPFVDMMTMNFESKKKEQNNNEADSKYAKSEMRAIIHSIMACTRDKAKHFIDPIDEHRLPKLKQLSIARKYFTILPYEFSIIKKKINFKEAITKALNNSEVGDKILYTTKVNQDELTRPYPWFIQEAVTGGKDVTCVYIKGEAFFYYCEYERGNKNIDWRTEINKDNQSKWLPLINKNLEELKKKACELMKEFDLNYGRLDFIQDKENFYFLEVNPNGQFGWIDLIENDNKFILHNKFAEAFLAE